ncbi:MAG: YdcF family protein [Patescibacteria group bacterium]|nr:YdcF family protein [Patescibacteria group bacterium]
MQNISRKTLIKLSLGGFFCIIAFILSVIFYVRTSNLDKIVEFDKAPQAQAIIILGASLKPDGTPSDALKDRLIRGAELYEASKAPTILITGDGGLNRADEITSMHNFLLDLQIPNQAIIEDRHGYRTYESCKRAKQEFNIDNAILVTQQFHLVRALYICNALGVDSTGIASDLQTYEKINFFTLRDYLASFKAWIDINIWEPKSPIS